MDVKVPLIPLSDGLDLNELQTSGSILHINEVYDESDTLDREKDEALCDLIGQPVQSIEAMEKQMTPVDSKGLVKKCILFEGGGVPLSDESTVFIAFSGYYENEPVPFDSVAINKPMEVDLNDNGLLPGILIAVKSMLVGETSVFVLSYQVMYGELGIPPRIKPKADCVFYIKIIKGILTEKQKKINFSEPNMFGRVRHEVKLLLSSGLVMYKNSNYFVAIKLFKKAVYMLHKCRLADEEEEKMQEKLLIKLYTNLAISYNKVKRPLQTCIACNELRRLEHLFNNDKALFQNAKALRMIGEFNTAEKRLRRAMKLCKKNKEMDDELKLIKNSQELCNQKKLVVQNVDNRSQGPLTDDFKYEVDELIKNFIENMDLQKLTIPASLNSTEMEYVKKVCDKEQLFVNKYPKGLLSEQEEPNKTDAKSDEHNYILDKENNHNKTLNSEFQFNLSDDDCYDDQEEYIRDNYF